MWQRRQRQRQRRLMLVLMLIDYFVREYVEADSNAIAIFSTRTTMMTLLFSLSTQCDWDEVKTHWFLSNLWTNHTVYNKLSLSLWCVCMCFNTDTHTRRHYSNVCIVYVSNGATEAKENRVSLMRMRVVSVYVRACVCLCLPNTFYVYIWMECAFFLSLNF